MSSQPIKRGWLDPSPSLPPLLAPWEYHHDYGIVHPSGCSVCRPYMDHLAEASYSTTQPSFQAAIEAKNRRRDDDYFDGIAEGRYRQKADDRLNREDMERYRTDRDAAREQLEDVKAELEIARGALEKWKEECEHLRRRATVEVNPGDRPETHAASSDNNIEKEFSSNSVPPGRLSRIMVEPIRPPPPGRQIASYAAAASSQLPSPPTTAHPSRQASGLPSDGPPSTPPVLPSSPTARSPSLPIPKHIRHIQSLCTAAHTAGNHTALARIKALCTAAHATPKERKTDAQRWLLSNWRAPAWERERAASGGTDTSTLTSSTPTLSTGIGGATPMQPPRLDSPIDTWVAYLTVHPTSWPRGVRKDEHGKPLYADVKASRIVARLRPLASGEKPRDGTANQTSNNGSASPTTPNGRNSFTTLAVTLFADPTLYPSFLAQHDIQIAQEVMYQRYDGLKVPGTEMSLLDVVRHFASCGISEETGKEMGGWAREYLRAATPSG